MAVGSTQYPHPVQVNGFICHNCTEVDRAKKHIDPAHPRSGPYGIDAAADPSNPKRFLQFAGDPSGNKATTATTARRATGALVDIQA